MKVDQELLKMGQRLQIVFQTKKDTCFLLRSKLHLPIIMAENGADHSHLLPSPVTISLERNDRFFLKTRLKKDTHKHPRRPPRRSFATRPESKIDFSNNGLIMGSWTNVQVSAELIGKTEVVEKLDAVIKEAMKMMEKESLA